MAHAGKLVIKQGVLAQAADAHSHAVLGVAVQLGLRTIRLGEVMQELLGCAGQVKLLCGAAEVCPCLQNLLLGGLLLKAYKHGSGVAVGDRHAEALCGDHRLFGVHDMVALNVAPQLERLALALFFLAANVGDHIVHDLGHTVKGLTCTGNGLIGAHQSLADTKILHQRVQGGNIALQAAVGLDGNKAALGAQALALCGDDFQVVCIDFRHYHRNIRCHAVCTVVGNHRAFCLGVSFFQRFDFVLFHVDCTEHKIHLCSNFFHLGSIQNHHLFDCFRHRCFHQRLPTASS